MSMNLCKISIYLKKQNIVKHKNLLSRREIGKEIVKFGDIENEKDKLYRHKSPIFLKDVDIKEVLVLNKISSGKEFLQGTQGTKTLLVPCIMIVKLNHYI